MAVINETLAKQYFPAGDAVGHQIRMPNLKADPPITQAIPESNDWLEIIGVVGDALDDGLGKPVKPGIYVPYTIWMPLWTQILVRTEVPPLTILHGVREQIHSVDADQQASGPCPQPGRVDHRTAGVGAAAPGGDAVRGVRGAGAVTGRRGPVQRRVLHCGTANQ